MCAEYVLRAHVGKDRHCSSRNYFRQIRRNIIVIFHRYVVAFVTTGHINIYIYIINRNVTLYIYNNRNFEKTELLTGIVSLLV